MYCRWDIARVGFDSENSGVNSSTSKNLHGAFIIIAVYIYNYKEFSVFEIDILF